MIDLRRLTPRLGTRANARAPLLARLARFSAFVCCLALLSCARGGEAEKSLLYGRLPSRAAEVTEVARLTDGNIAVEGDHWETDRTSVLRTSASEVDWDLGRPVHVVAAYMQGDNNDDFFLLGSDDGQTYRRLWGTGTVSGSGMRGRLTKDIDATVRYLRVSARGGDPAVSLSEVAVFDAVPATWPPRFHVRAGSKPLRPGEVESLVFGIVTAAALLLHRWTFPRWLKWITLGAPIVTAFVTYQAVTAAWPPDQAVIDALRAVAALVSAAAVLRLAWRPEDIVPRFVDGWLWAMALLAMTTFYNMWQPQFSYEEKGRQTWVHTWDMRVYYPTAKYFDELGFDGLYLASVAAYLEDAPGANEARVARVELRDLTTYDMTTVDRVREQVRTISRRFSPQRWIELKRDMAFFWHTMGAGGYLGSLRDHGGNATPAWMFVAHLMFAKTTATEAVLVMAALLDPLLLLGFFVAAWRTFGLRTALVCIVIFGTSTFPWFGSNWAGSTLRNDWMVCVGFGACALRKERYFLGGALLAGAAMIRAFPAIAVMFLVVPLLAWLIDSVQKERRLPDFRPLLTDFRPVFRALAGATACVLVLFLLSGLWFGFSHSWGAWSHKISMHSVQPNVNHVGLRTLFQYHPGKTLNALARTGGDWSIEQMRTFHVRRPLFFGTVAVFSLLAFAACRRRDLRQVALIGMMMIPIYFYPSNYYLHYVFVLPLLIDYSEEDKRQRWLWGAISVIMLLVCVSEYWGFADIGVDERYVQWSVGLLVGYLVILVLLARDAMPRAALEAPVPALEAPQPTAEAAGAGAG
jgi:hypothetical protein